MTGSLATRLQEAEERFCFIFLKGGWVTQMMFWVYPVGRDLEGGAVLLNVLNFQVRLHTRLLPLAHGFGPVKFPLFLLDLTLLAGRELTKTLAVPHCSSAHSDLFLSPFPIISLSSV